ncbi:DMT family transporter [Bradyrhizobium jicamae]|uniref:DMT family transporter n=1 Tax=Bradyrhizobium jicamae TaxID=280332 RepID=UPI001BADFB28|nr:DMT family transporter [Bradyrhizobium jicamae]MBR0751400.1 DMT family transporter [Bradyrhizobium jicamae]
MTVDVDRQHRTGIVLVVAAAVAWSTAPFFTRLLHQDSWTILFWRGVFASIFITSVLAVTEGRKGLRNLVAMRPHGWLVAGLSAFGMMTFIPSLQLTSVANVAVIVAVQPFAAAAIAWIWLREKVALRTLLASLLAFAGIVITVSGATGAADYRGIGLAVAMMLAISLMTVVIRRHRETSMLSAVAMSNLISSLTCLPFAYGHVLVSQADLVTLALFGFCQVGMGLTLFTLGSRLMPSGQASLIATLETPLMPFWVWLAFHEVPSGRALIGGALVMGAVIADIVADRRVQAVAAP